MPVDETGAGRAPLERSIMPRTPTTGVGSMSRPLLSL